MWLNSYKHFCHLTWSEVIIFEHTPTLIGIWLSTETLENIWPSISDGKLGLLSFTSIQWGFFGACTESPLEKLHLNALLNLFLIERQTLLLTVTGVRFLLHLSSTIGWKPTKIYQLSHLLKNQSDLIREIFDGRAAFGDTDLIHAKWWAGGLALAPQVNFTFSWPTCQFLSIPIMDTIGATVKQNKTKGYYVKNLHHLQRTKLLECMFYKGGVILLPPQVGSADQSVFYFYFKGWKTRTQ